MLYLEEKWIGKGSRQSLFPFSINFWNKILSKTNLKKNPKKTKQRKKTKKQKLSRHRDGELLFLYFDIILKRKVRRRKSANQNKKKREIK